MNPLQIGALTGLLVAAAVGCVVLALQRAPRSLASARHRLYGHDVGRSTVLPHHDVDGHRASAADRIAEHLAGGFAGRMVVRRWGAGLQAIDLTVADVVSRVLASAGIMLFAVVAAVSALTATGLLSPSLLWPALAVVLAVMAGWITAHDISGRIERRHRELRQAANDFVQLTAIGLTTDQSVEEAIRFALAVGASDAFATLRAELETAPQRGLAVWEALEEFGTRHQVRELTEFAASIERQGLQGVSISDTVSTMAAAMRAKTLDQLEREADAANANLAGPTIGFVVTMVVFLAYPLAQRIGEAFGG